jgi:hypothetical protein
MRGRIGRAALSAAAMGLALTLASSAGAAGPVRHIVVAVPEPASWALMMLGMGGVGGLMRLKRRQRRAALV